MRSKSDRPTKAALAYMAWIKRQRCICCELLGREQESVTDCHHIRADREARSDYLVIPVCHDDCHQGPKGIHGDKTWLRMLKVSEWGLLAATLERAHRQRALPWDIL
jgi:hypothetical protein